MTREQGHGVYHGLRVLDFTIALAGVYTAWQFADLGAEVWKVERSGVGDQTRSWDPIYNGLSTLYVAYNKNKKSIEIDLSSPQGKEVIFSLVKDCDLVLENFKSGSMDRLGLGYEALREYNPKLVFLSLSGFGATGPLRKAPCYDAIAAARGGFAASNGEPDGAPMKAGNANCDTLAGTYAFAAVAMGLIDARRTGTGCRIDLAMTDVAMLACGETLMDYSRQGHAQMRFGNHDRFAAPHGLFEARDGWVAIVADTQSRWLALCDALDMPALKTEEPFLDNAARLRNREALVARLEAVTRTLHRRELEERLLAADVPASQVLPFIEAYTSDHANETGVTAPVWQEGLGLQRFYNNPLRFDNGLCPIRSGAPLLGQDTRSILQAAGYSTQEIDSLYADGVVGSTLI